jgi:hypothetical protein
MADKRIDEGNTAPEEVLQGVRRWMDSLEKSDGIARAHIDAHPDWPSVVRWASEYPDKRHLVREYQQNILKMRNALAHSESVSVAAFRVLRLIRLFSPRRPAKIKIARPPGLLMLRVSRFLMRPEAFSRYVVPFVADIQHEYFEAWKSGERWRARWAVLRGYWHILWPLAAGIAATVRALVNLKGA